MRSSPARAASPHRLQEVYGSATKSNNNSWLRRKLYEAVGVTPLKASTKGKARKSHAPAHGSHARKPAAPKDAARCARCRGSVGLGCHCRACSTAATSCRARRRTCADASPCPRLAPLRPHRAPKVAPVRTKRPGGADLAAGSPLYGGGGGMSVLDPHHQQNSEDSTDSDGGSGGTPRSAPLAAFDGTVFSGQPLGGAALPPPPPGFVPVAVAEPQSPTAGGAHWADQGSHWAAPVPALSPFVAAASRQLAPVEAGSGLADFRPVGSSSEPACPASDLAAGHWYFGSLDLACLCPTPMDCGAAAACTAPSCCRDDEDEVPLLTLDLGGE